MLDDIVSKLPKDVELSPDLKERAEGYLDSHLRKKLKDSKFRRIYRWEKLKATIGSYFTHLRYFIERKKQ